MPGSRVPLAALAVGAGLVVVAAGLSTTLAAAAGSGPLAPGSFGTGTAVIKGCSPDPITLDQIRTGFTSVDQPKYEVRSVRFASVPATCVGLKFRLTVLNNTGSYEQLAGLSGTVPAAGNSVTFSAGTGPDLNSLNVSNNQLVLAVVVYSG